MKEVVTFIVIVIVVIVIVNLAPEGFLQDLVEPRALLTEALLDSGEVAAVQSVVLPQEAGG